jgi:hypothetical protein
MHLNIADVFRIGVVGRGRVDGHTARTSASPAELPS